jgi:5-enolpyruvylshikimate-3-phosphate synthase
VQYVSNDLEQSGKALTYNMGKILVIVSHGQETTGTEERNTNLKLSQSGTTVRHIVSVLICYVTSES